MCVHTYVPALRMSVCYFVKQKLQRFDTVQRAEKFIVALCALVQFDVVHCMGNTV